MFDRQVQTLTNVLHLPDLKKNLLSLEAFEAQGCKLSGEDGGVKVIKGSMIILKGERIVNLYKMIGSFIVGDTSVKTENTTRLWYMYIGHMSERGFQALHNKSVLPGIKYCKLGLRKFYIMGKQSKVTFSTSQHNTAQRA